MEARLQRPVGRSSGPIFAVGLALGASAVAARVAGSVARGVGSRVVAPSLAALARWGVAPLLDAFVPVAVAEVLRRVDLTAVVITHVDLVAVLRAVGEWIDADEIPGAIDRPEIIRQSTGALASGFVRRVRVRGMAAGDAMGRVRDRLRRRAQGPA